MEAVFFYLYLSLASSSPPGMGSSLNIIKRGKTLHCIGLKWDPTESQTNFCWTKAETKPDMCTVLFKFMQMEELMCLREWQLVGTVYKDTVDGFCLGFSRVRID